MIRNEYLSSLAGELPAEQTWPELFILNDSDIFKAEEILTENEARLNDMPSFCPKCDSEEIDLVKGSGMFSFDTFKCRKCKYVWNKR
jgi:transposase-like protein